MLAYRSIPVTRFGQNRSLVWCDETRKAAVIDPGGDLELVLSEAERLGLDLEQTWLTHAHIDHAGAAAELARRLGLPIIGPHQADQSRAGKHVRPRAPEQPVRRGPPAGRAGGRARPNRLERDVVVHVVEAGR